MVYNTPQAFGSWGDEKRVTRPAISGAQGRRCRGCNSPDQARRDRGLVEKARAVSRQRCQEQSGCQGMGQTEFLLPGGTAPRIANSLSVLLPSISVTVFFHFFTLKVSDRCCDSEAEKPSPCGFSQFFPNSAGCCAKEAGGERPFLTAALWKWRFPDCGNITDVPRPFCTPRHSAASKSIYQAPNTRDTAAPAFRGVRVAGGAQENISDAEWV